jgi:hypothetical protein
MTEDSGKWISEDAVERCKPKIYIYKIQPEDKLFGENQGMILDIEKLLNHIIEEQKKRYEDEY